MPIPETINENEAKADANSAIHVWVLNSSIVYSSSGASRRTPAVKLLYRLLPHEEADKMMESLTCDSQEINLPTHGLREVVQYLDRSNVLLPPTERLFKEWKVGLLARWG